MLAAMLAWSIVHPWVPLFDGKSLKGWTPKIKGCKVGENFRDTFRVKDGKIVVAYDDYGGKFDGRFGHLFYRDPFSHYRLRLEYRFVGDQLPDGPSWATRNSGVMVHGQSPASMRLDQDFPVSIEVQLLGAPPIAPDSIPQERHTGNVCTPGTHIVRDGKLWTQHCTDSSSATIFGNLWAQLEIEVRGSGTIIHRINGVKVLEYEKPQYDPSDTDAKSLMQGKSVLIESGTISLQSESHPVEFRNIEIQRL